MMAAENCVIVIVTVAMFDSAFDELYDFLHSIGMKPFVELGFMPNALASAR